MLRIFYPSAHMEANQANLYNYTEQLTDLDNDRNFFLSAFNPAESLALEVDSIFSSIN